MNAPGNSYLQLMQSTSLLSGGNNAFVEGLYEDYLQDTSSVPAEWRAYFDKLQAANLQHDVAHSPIRRGFLELDKHRAEAPANADESRKQAKVLQLINAYRFLGARVAELDPLKRHPAPEVAELNPAYYGLNEADMDATFFTGSLEGGKRMTLRDILQRVRRIYCSTVGAEYMYISSVVEKRWLQARLEGPRASRITPMEPGSAFLSG